MPGIFVFANMWHKKSRVGWFFMDMHRNHLRLQDRYFTVLDTPDCKLTIFASTLAITMILFLGFFLQSHMTVKILI